MKTALQVHVVGFLLYCSIAAGQEPSPTLIKAPYAGATVSDFKGKVGIQLPGQAFTDPSRGEALPPETTVNTDEGRLLLRLSDGSDVLVRPHTRLLIKEPEASAWRYLQLLVGRIHTQIQKHLGGTPPVQIGTPSAVISVRGTRFDVEVDRRGFTEVDVEEGVVELNSAAGRGEGVLITAGFSSRVGMGSLPEVPRPTHDLRPQLDRPGRNGHHDDDPMRRLAAADPDRHGRSERGSPGSDDDRSSGSDGGDRSGSSSGDRSGSGEGDHHGGKPPV
jgi:FecR protein